MMPSSWSVLSGLVLLSSISLVSATWSDNFDRFFPEYNRGFQTLLNNECAGNYTEYLKDREKITIDPRLRIFDMESVTSNVVQCLLQAAPELIKAKMASAQVGIFQSYFRNSSLMSLGYSRVHSLSGQGSRVLS